MSKIEIVCIVGRSGSGKTKLVERLKELGHKVVLDCTTRPRRHVNDQNHTFVSPEEFEQMRSELAAYTTFDGHKYGATKEQVKECHLYIIDPNGLKSMLEIAGKKNFLIVYLAVTPVAASNRLTEERGFEHVSQRFWHDLDVYGSSTIPDFDFDLLLPNETIEDFERNVGTIDSLLRGIFG